MTGLELTRYTVRREIGRGGMGVVYEAWDRLEGRQVALKQLAVRRTAGSTWGSGLLEAPRSPSTESSGALALAGEFATLAGLRHPHVVEVLDYGFDADGQPFFTMELLDGAIPIHSWVEDHPDDVPELLAQLLEALRYLHRHGVLHLDLKPQNALVVGTVDGPRLALLDFGLAILREDARYAPAAGTPAYVAPEVAAGSRPTPASDLYSVGVLAWRLLAGDHPYAGDDTRATLSAARESGWRDQLPDGVPDGIAALLHELVSVDPALRPGSTAEVLRRWRTGFGTQVGEQAAIQRSFLQRARFVARTRELGQLTSALGEALRGTGSCWLLEGESGSGKSRLVDELCVRARVRGVTVLIGQSSDSRLVAFDLWRGVIPGLALVASLDPLDAQVLGALSPDLGRVMDRELEPPPELSGAAALARLLATVERVFDRVETPLLVILEDLHWARAESRALLERLARGMAGRPCLVVATSRPGDADLDDVRRLPLGPLSRTELAVLSEAVLGVPGREAQLVRRLDTLSAGRVFWAIEAVRACVDASGTVDAVSASALEGLEDRADLVRSRLESLEERDLARLELAAVAGRRLDIGLLRTLEGPIEGWLEGLADAALLDVQHGHWRIAHDAIRQIVLERLSPSRRRKLHSRLATALRDHGASAAELAEHLSAAGQVDEAVPVQLQAAEEALAMGASAEAESFAMAVLNARLLGVTAAQTARAQRCAIEAAYAAGELAVALARVETLRDQLVGSTALRRTVSRAGTVISLLVGPRVEGGTDVWIPRLEASESGFEAAQWAGKRALSLDLLLLGYRAARALGLKNKLAAYHGGTALVLNLTPLRGWVDTFLGWADVSVQAGLLQTRERIMYEAATALIFLQRAEWERAKASFGVVYDLSEQTGDQLHAALTIRHLWLIAVLQDDRERSASLSEQLDVIARHDVNPRVRGSALMASGFEALFRGRWDDAGRLLGEALAVIEPTRERPTITSLRGGLAWAALGSGDRDLALRLARENAQEVLDFRPTGIGGMFGMLAGFLVLATSGGDDLVLAQRAADQIGGRFVVAQPMAALLRSWDRPSDLDPVVASARELGLPLIADLAEARRSGPSDVWDEPGREGWRPALS